MGIVREDGYSASVEGFLVIDESTRLRLAKTNGFSLLLAEPCELPAGTEADLLIIIDGTSDSKRVVLPEGATADNPEVKYLAAVPF